MPKPIDMKGKKFGHLQVINEAGTYFCPNGENRAKLWRCKCDCGKVCVVRGSYLRRGYTKTCGYCHHFIPRGSYMECVCKNGKKFLFDASDYTIVSAHRWSVDQLGYVSTSIAGCPVKLHRLLLHPNADEVVDHINSDPSDCRRNNLRVVKQCENTCNQSLPKSSTTGYKGVYYDMRRHMYLANIHPKRRTVFLGYYTTPEEAAIAYNEAALFHFGEYARINVVGQPFVTVSAAEA